MLLTGCSTQLSLIATSVLIDTNILHWKSPSWSYEALGLSLYLQMYLEGTPTGIGLSTTPVQTGRPGSANVISSKKWIDKS